MAAPINRTTVFHEIADSVMGLKDVKTQFMSKSPSDQNEVIRRTTAAACAGGYLGWMLTPLGPYSFLVAVFAFSHFSHKDLKQPSQVFSAFDELDKVAEKTWHAVQQFLQMTDKTEQAILAAKVIGVAVTVGLIGRMIGFSPVHLFAATVPFTLVYFTHFPKDASEPAPKVVEQPTPDSEGDIFEDSVEILET